MSPLKNAKKPNRRKGQKAKPLGQPVTQLLKDLLFDEENPRLPEELKDRSQDNLLKYIATEYHPIEVARSIAAHGYFPSEPLIIIRASAPAGGSNRWTVVEGNRRLAALKLLAESSKSEGLQLHDSQEWKEAAAAASLPSKIPCILASSRDQVAPIIGYRHISGIEPWDPWAKARFLASLIEDQKLSFERSASEVGEAARTVRESYRNFRITIQAGEMGIDTARVRSKFGVFARAMQESNIRSFISAVDSKEIKRGRSAFRSSAKAKPRVKELVSWIFGSQQEEPLLTDSRKLADLGRIVADKDALDELRQTRDLESAFALTGGIQERLVARLSKAATNLEAALQDFSDYAEEDEVKAAVTRCRSALKALK